MYPITEDVRVLFEKKQRQTVEVKVELKDGSTADDFSITEADIVSGSFSIDRYCTSGENIEIGSAIASELKFTLDNSKGKFDNVTLGGAKLFVRLGIKDWNDSEAAMNHMDCGYFTIDEEPRPLTQISVAALDNMMRFDRPVNWDKIVFPITPKALLDISCDACDVTLSTEFDFSALPNSSYEIKARPSTTDITYRQLIQWIAELTGTCAFIDWRGYLRFQWLENTPVEINPSNRYSSVVNDPITITGVQITQDENTVHLHGEEGYVFNIEGNELIQDNHLEIAQNLGAVLCGFSYVPFECSCFPMPYLYPLDIVSFTDIKGNVFNTMVTAHVYTLNGASNMKGVGETQQQKGYSTSNPFTKRESLIIKQLQKNNDTNLNRIEQETLDLNKALANALGLYDTTVKHDDGSATYYYHSKPTLEECVEGDVIFCLNAEGFGVSNSGWNDGSPTFTGGLEAKNGKAIWQYLSAHKLTADLIEAGILKSVDGNTYFDLNAGEMCTKKESVYTDTDGTTKTESIKTSFSAGRIEFNSSFDDKTYSLTIDPAGMNIDAGEEGGDLSSYVFVKPDGFDSWATWLQNLYKLMHKTQWLWANPKGITISSTKTDTDGNVKKYDTFITGSTTKKMCRDENGNEIAVSEYRADGATINGIDLTLQNKLLWSGAELMDADTSIALSEAISKQPHGIVLVFSYNSVDGTAQNYQFHSFFKSKYEVATHPGGGQQFMLCASNFGVMATKYLYISDLKITGYVSNTASGKASTGITYDNNRYVLRYVIGI